MSFDQQAPFLVTSRKFPQDKVDLESVLTKSYIEIAQAVNNRTISLYETIQTVTGNRYFNNGDQQNRRQSFRKIFSFGSIASGASRTMIHGISEITSFVQIYGTCRTDSPDSRPLPYVSITNVNEQIQVNVTSSQIIISNGAGANNILDGIIVLEYLLN
jgi:hypothetical protein